ncbi:hypothetical protein [Hymenobacter jeollabukensis]|uniref:Uncharacterized protein n=1 Tax=Hymenobacter jeollabukensis TaxID=2025313 RepID=A0A5R8WJP0_9BACT|nr:hypothetical protein [Hymenobacter jeollabukensis]TLM88989.1 hypothetical protein FDY95_22675 [Hymenobacter jeollabukensis]
MSEHDQQSSISKGTLTQLAIDLGVPVEAIRKLDVTMQLEDQHDKRMRGYMERGTQERHYSGCSCPNGIRMHPDCCGRNPDNCCFRQ